MAQILISEPHGDVRRMLVRACARLGHEPVVVTMPTPAQFFSADIVLVEPTAPIGAVLVQASRLIDPSLPVICVSVAAPPAELVELGVAFDASLLKPFTAEQLAAAIDRVLRAAEEPSRAASSPGGDRAA